MQIGAGHQYGSHHHAAGVMVKVPGSSKGDIIKSHQLSQSQQQQNAKIGSIVVGQDQNKVDYDISAARTQSIS